MAKEVTVSPRAPTCATCQSGSAEVAGGVTATTPRLLDAYCGRIDKCLSMFQAIILISFNNACI